MINVNATLVIQIINLLVLLVIMNSLLYRPLKRLMAEREQKVAHGLSQATHAREQCETDEEKYQRGLRKGRAAVQDRLAALREEAKGKAQALVLETQEKAQAKFRETVAHIEQEISEAKKDIRQEAQKVALAMASQILGRGLS